MRRGFADLNSRHEAAPIAFQADKGGGERTRFREELLAILALEATLHHHDRGFVRTSRFDGDARRMRRASRQNRASECRESHEFFPLLSTGSELGRRPEHLKGETPTLPSDARPFCGIFRPERS